VAGTLVRPTISRGDPVTRDQVLARIIPDPVALADPQTLKQLSARLAAAEAAKDKAVAERADATAKLDQVRAELRETEQLAAAGQADAMRRDQAQLAVKLAFKDLESANYAVHTAAFDIEAAQAALAQAKQNPPSREWLLRAPQNGTLLSIGTAGKTVSLGAPVLEIGTPDDLEVVLEMAATELAQVPAGQRVVLTPANGDSTLDGRVRRAEPIPAAEGGEPERGLLLVEFTAPPVKWRNLGEGHPMRARITTAVVDSVLKAPTSAVFTEGAQTLVYVVESGKARKRAVTLGAHNADEVVIASGLKEYDRVILSPAPTIKDGSRVKFHGGSQ
jgi:HlyD family secretion protein